MKPAARRRFRSILAYGFITLVFITGVALRFREPPLISIAEIVPSRRFSRVRLEGTLTRDPIRLRDGAMMFPLSDGTGTIAVFVEARLVGPPPREGAAVSVVGDLLIGAGANRRLRVTEASWVRVRQDESVRLGAAGSRVEASGVVMRIWRPEEGSRAPHRITLETDHGEVEIVHWLEEVVAVETGAVVQVTGRVDEYRGQKRIKLSAANAVRRID